VTMSTLSPLAASALEALRPFGAGGRQFRFRYDRLASDIGCSERQAGLAVKDLQQAGLVSVEIVGPHRRQMMTIADA
jgi:hypothetical protein